LTQPTITVSLGQLTGWQLGTAGSSELGVTTTLATYVYTPITSRVIDFSIRRGRQHELDRIETGTATATLVNQDGAVTPTNTSSVYYPDIRPMAPIKIQASFFSSPTDITGLVAWYDYSDIATLWKDTARTSPVTADADVIKGVTDKSGVGNHLAEATNGPTYKTAIQNGKSIARFDGTNDTLEPAANPSAAAASGTLFYVQKVTSEATANASPWGRAGSDALDDHHPFSDANIYDGFGSTARKSTGNPPGLTTSFYIGAFVSAPSDYRAYKDGGAAYFSTGTNTVGWNASPPRMGRTGTGASFTAGDIAEVLVYNPLLSLTDMNLIGNYLASKWGVTWTTAS